METTTILHPLCLSVPISAPNSDCTVGLSFFALRWLAGRRAKRWKEGESERLELEMDGSMRGNRGDIREEL